MKQKIKRCRKCGVELTEANFKICPECGAKIATPIYKKWWFWVIIGALVIGIAAGSSNASDNTDGSTTNNTSNASTQSSNNPGNSNSTNSSSNNKISAEYKNALAKAKIYSDTMHMSKQGIYDQLTSEYGENFPADAAQYAIDNLNANYKENALAKAKTYSNTMHMSKQSIYEQLISEYGEQFTEAEAQYAIDHLED